MWLRQIDVTAQKTQRVGSRRAFTLVEIIIVIFVIGVLMSIALPVMLNAREKGRTTTCLSNLAQLHRAYALYAQDHDELIPPYQNSLVGIKYKDLPNVQTAPRTDLLKSALHSYTGGSEPIWHCPSDAGSYPEGVNINSQTSYYTSRAVCICIAYNLIPDMTGMPPDSQIQKSPPTAATLRDAEPSRSFLIGERIGGMTPFYTHNDLLNFVYFDGHAKSIPWRDAPL